MHFFSRWISFLLLVSEVQLSAGKVVNMHLHLIWVILQSINYSV